MRNKGQFQKATIILALILILTPVSLSAWAGGTNSTFARMDHYVNELEKAHQLSPEEVQGWRNKLQGLRDKVDTRIKANGGGMNRNQDKDIFEEIDSCGKPLFEKYQQLKNPSK